MHKWPSSLTQLYYSFIIISIAQKWRSVIHRKITKYWSSTCQKLIHKCDDPLEWLRSSTLLLALVSKEKKKCLFSALNVSFYFLLSVFDSAHLNEVNFHSVPIYLAALLFNQTFSLSHLPWFHSKELIDDVLQQRRAHFVCQAFIFLFYRVIAAGRL